jgi:hypothetical protein
MGQKRAGIRHIGLVLVGGAGGYIMSLINWLVPTPNDWLRHLGWGLVIAFTIIFIYGLILIIRSYRKTQVELQEKDTIISEQRERLAELRQRLNVRNQRILKLHQSLDELFYDVRSKRMTETEYQTTEYQTRIKDCRKLASSTGDPMATARTSAILNLIHLYLQRVEQARKEDNADFSIEVIDSTFSTKINTHLGLLLNEVQNE